MKHFRRNYIYADKVVIWLQVELHQGYVYRVDLDIERARVHDVRGLAKEPEWLKDELDQSGWSSLLHFGVSDNDKLRWMKHYNIAPYQPFRVVVFEPKYYRCSYEYEEYDADYNYKVLDVEPVDHAGLLRRWHAWGLLGLRTEVLRQISIHMRHRRAVEDTGAMYLARDDYPEGYGDGWPWGHTKGVFYRLLTTRDFPGWYMAEGRHEREMRWDPETKNYELVREASWDIAMERLVATATKRYPSLTEEFIRNLPVRR